MKFFSVILTICILQACSSQTPSDAWSTTPEPDIDENGLVFAGEHPYHVVIRSKDLSNRTVLICQGALFENNFVVTAAGCVENYTSNPDHIDVVAGLTSLNHTEEYIESGARAQKRVVSEVKIHPNWIDSNKTSGDLALLKLDTPFRLNKYVNIPPYVNEKKTDGKAKLIAYGDSDFLEITDLITPLEAQCEKKLNSKLTNGTFCAKNEENPRRAYWAQENIGAPVVSLDFFEDIEIYGLSTSEKIHPYTSIAYYLEWIESITKVKRAKKPDNSSKRYDDLPSSPTTESGN